MHVIQDPWGMSKSKRKRTPIIVQEKVEEENSDEEFDAFVEKVHKKDTGGFSEPVHIAVCLAGRKYLLRGYSEAQVVCALDEACDRTRDDLLRVYWDEREKVDGHERTVEQIYEKISDNGEVFDVMHVFGNR